MSTRNLTPEEAREVQRDGKQYLLDLQRDIVRAPNGGDAAELERLNEERKRVLAALRVAHVVLNAYRPPPAKPTADDVAQAKAEARNAAADLHAVLLQARADVLAAAGRADAAERAARRAEAGASGNSLAINLHDDYHPDFPGQAWAVKALRHYGQPRTPFTPRDM